MAESKVEEKREQVAALKERRAEKIAIRGEMRGPQGRHDELERDRLHGAGARYREAALSDDPDALLAVQREHERLGAEIDQINYRLRPLERELMAAEEEAAVQGAKAKASAAVEKVREELDVRDEHRTGLAASDRRAKELALAVRDARRLDPSAPGLDPTTLRRLRTTTDGEIMVTTQDVRELLEPIEPGIVARVRDYLTGPFTTTGMYRGESRGPSEREIRRVGDEVRVRLIKEGEFDRLAEADEIAAEIIQERAGGHRAGTPEAVARWLAREAG